MEELSIEQKAKAYDEALEKARQLCAYPTTKPFISDLQDLFPELKEDSEDEKIRKEIINFLELPHPQFVGKRDHEKWLAWLEKQKPIILTGDDLSTLKNWVGYIQDKASELELNDWFVEATEKVVNKMKTLLIQHPNIIPKEMDVDDTNFWLERQGEDKKEINNFDVLPGLYKCVHRMFDGTPDGRLLFEVGNVYKCLSKHDRAEFEVSYGHSVYLEDPVVCKHFIPFEKQGEQKPVVEMKTPEESLGIDSETYNEIVNDCIFGENKPKFKVGDWIVFNGLTLYVKEVVKGFYRTISKGGIPNSYDWDIDNVARLWAIQDTKDGDVLINDFHLIFIFKEIKDNTYISHCSTIDRGNHNLIVNSMAEREVGDVNLVKCQPATEEQCDLLFQKMKEAGYEWDAENKELKKIGQKPVVIIPKFRIGDNIKTTNEEPLTITKIDGKGYWSEDLLVCGFDDAAKWELVEQKPADKVEPKFKVDDWVVYYRNDSSREALQVYDIRDGRYYFTDNVHFSWSVKECDEKSHLWTIQDAKDGDVLACENGWTGIFKCLNDNLFSSYCFMDGKGWFCEDGGQGHTLDERICGEIHPATQKQRDTLIKAMADAGYTFDFDKRDLKKIEQKPNPCDECINVKGCINCENGELREAEQKPAWSEEDEEMLRSIIATCELTEQDRDSSPARHLLEMQLNWLKSLKDRYTWKPSDEQMEALWNTLHPDDPYYVDLSSLYNDLKKLREDKP